MSLIDAVPSAVTFQLMSDTPRDAATSAMLEYFGDTSKVRVTSFAGGQHMIINALVIRVL